MTTGAVSAHRLILRTLILAGAGIAAWAALTSAAHADTQPKPGLLTALDGLVTTVTDGTETPLTQAPAAKPSRPPAATRPRAPRPPKPRPPAVPNAPAIVGEGVATVHGITHQAGATVGQLVETVTDLPDNLPSELPPLAPEAPEAPEDTPQPVTPVPQPDRAVKPAPQQRQAAPASPTRPEPTPDDGPSGARQRVDHAATIAPRQTMDVCWPDWDPAPEAPPRLTPPAIHDTADLPHGWALSPPTTRAGPVPAIDAAGRHPGSPSPSG